MTRWPDGDEDDVVDGREGRSKERRRNNSMSDTRHRPARQIQRWHSVAASSSQPGWPVTSVTNNETLSQCPSMHDTSGNVQESDVSRLTHSQQAVPWAAAAERQHEGHRPPAA